MKKPLVILAYLSAASCFSIFSGKQLVARLSPPPTSAISQAKEEFQKLNPNDELPDSFKIKKDKRVSGFMTIYGGYYDFSDKDGTISFPLRHESPKSYIVITPRVEMIKLLKETISHQKVGPAPVSREISIPSKSGAKIYLLEKLKNKDNSLYWSVTEQPIPENRKISKIAITILTNPDNIFVPTGNFFISEKDHMVLPAIHVVGRKGVARSISNNIEITRYFEPIRKKNKNEKKENLSIQQDILTNA
jgi:hypothetical protein